MVTSYEFKKQCCLLRSCLGARRMVLLMTEQVFLPRGDVWSKGIRQSSVEEKEDIKGQRILFMFFCLAIAGSFAQSHTKLILLFSL